MILRFFLFCTLVCAAVVLPTWLFAICAFFYALRFTAYELIILTCAIDAFYGAGSFAIPYYTLVASGALFIIEWIKPRLSVYN